MLRMGLEGEVESGESSASEDMVKPTPEQTVQRFEHYQLVTGEDGKPVELGRGAMGVTYKAFDVDLHCPVTLKVIGVLGTMQSIFRSASRREALGKHSKGRRRDAGLKMDWTKPLPRAWPMCIECRLDLG